MRTEKLLTARNAKGRKGFPPFGELRAGYFENRLMWGITRLFLRSQEQGRDAVLAAEIRSSPPVEVGPICRVQNLDSLAKPAL
jgi:hypothetical protein